MLEKFQFENISKRKVEEFKTSVIYSVECSKYKSCNV